MKKFSDIALKLDNIPNEIIITCTKKEISFYRNLKNLKIAK
jgi:hypothetical protein